MSFAIVAEFPLGTYRGGVGEGQLDRLPSVDRLHQAFMAAAGQGLMAVAAEDMLAPSEASISALAWIEENPPDGLALPLVRVNPATNSVFRDIGQLKPKMRGTKKAEKRDNQSTALAASLAWVWECNPPLAVLETLEDLCCDVAYLGQADSPVRLRITTTALPSSTHRRDAGARLATSRRTDLDLIAPRRGRAQVLVDAHRARLASAPPSVRADRARSDESDRRALPPMSATGLERYVPVDAVSRSTSPWAAAWVLPIIDRTGGIAVDERVRWSVALHRALIALHGDGAPSLLTGKYGDGVERPANRVGIHVVDRHPAMRHGLSSSQAFVITVPSGADPRDIEAIDGSVATVRTVRSGHGATVEIGVSDTGAPTLVDARRFWNPPEPALVRCWTTTPAVPETRPPRGGAWSLAEAVRLSVAMTWRDVCLTDEIGRLGRDERFRALSRAVLDRGVEVLDVRLLATSQVDRYVHKVNEGFVVQPYVAMLTLGDLDPDGTAWVAIGQSRHLGGGLLVPCDVAEPVLELWRHR